MENKRLSEIDILRGFAIFLVVLGHITHISELRNYIWGFHIPIFFFISGLLFNETKYDSFLTFFKHKIKNLVIPYTFFYLITFCYYILIESHIRGEISPFKLFTGLFYGSYYDNFMYFNGALWFLPCLFSIEIIGYSLKYIQHKFLQIFLSIIIYCIGIILIKNNIVWLPWGINAALCGFIYYSCGFCSKNILHSIFDRKYLNVVLITLCIVLQTFLFPFPSADLASGKISNYILYIPISIIGITLFLSFSCLIKRNKVLEYLGINSLVIFAFQEPVYRAVIFFFSKFLNTEVEMIRKSVVYCILMTIVSILIIVPLIYSYNKWMNPLLRKIKI